jgi:hypothetical protein
MHLGQFQAVLQFRLACLVGQVGGPAGFRLAQDGAGVVQFRLQAGDALLTGAIVGRQGLRRQVPQGIRRHRHLPLESDLPAQQGGKRHRHQHVGPARQVAFHEQHQRQGSHAHGQGGPVGLPRLQQHVVDVAEEVLAAVHGHAQQFVELGQGDDDGRRVGETNDHRVGQEVDDGAQAEQPQGELDDADHQGQQDGQGDVLFRAGRRQRRQGRSGKQGDDGHRPGGKLPRRSPQGAHHHGQESGI